MKKIISFRILMSCVLIGLMSTSCSKDPEPSRPIPCDNCGSISGNDLTPLYISDNIWVRQTSGVFKSDLGIFLHQAGFSAKQVYAIYIVNENELLQIFPFYNEPFMGGTVYGSVSTSYEGDACTVSFSYSKENEHYGQMPNGGGLPFQAMELKVLLLK